MLPMWKCCQFQCCQFSIGARRECAAWKAAFPVRRLAGDGSPYPAAAQERGPPDVAANEGYRTITIAPEGGGAA